MLTEDAKNRLTLAVNLGKQVGVIEDLREAGPRRLIAWCIGDFAGETFAENISQNAEEAERLVAGLLGLC